MPVALVIAVGFVVLFVSGGARFAVGLIFKPMVDELGWARGELGLAVGLYLVVSAFATFIAGRLADSALTLKVGLADFIRIIAGELKPVDLVMSGRMQLEGDFMLAAKLGPMFGEPAPAADSA